MQVLAPNAAMRNHFPFPGVLSRLVLGIFILTSIFSLIGISVITLTGSAASVHDFISYWAAGRLLDHGGNPYSESPITALERSVGYGNTFHGLVMRNPPSALFLVIPLGWMGSRIGSILWSMLILACLTAAIHIIGKTYGSPESRGHLLGYVFAPALACLATGQTGIFVLLGLALFLRFQDCKPWGAGMALSLCAVKPHLFLPFLVVLFTWIATRKAFRILAGGAIAIGICSVIPLLFDQSVWTQYARMGARSGLENEFMPNLGTLLRFALDKQAMWLQFLPALLASIWAGWYFHRHRVDWDWRVHGSLLMLVSLLAAPYSWFTDQVVLLPALIHGLYSGRSLLTFLALISATQIEVMFFTADLHSALYIWPAAAWLSWYIWPDWPIPRSM